MAGKASPDARETSHSTRRCERHHGSSALHSFIVSRAICHNPCRFHRTYQFAVLCVSCVLPWPAMAWTATVPCDKTQKENAKNAKDRKKVANLLERAPMVRAGIESAVKTRRMLTGRSSRTGVVSHGTENAAQYVTVPSTLRRQGGAKKLAQLNECPRGRG
jgi:hypothetical protein